MYQFVREDNGEIVEVDFEKMMEQDAAGFIKLDDGVSARRVQDLPRHEKKRRKKGVPEIPVSDALGFTAHQLAEFEYDRKSNGFSGVEFTPDPMCPEFYQVRFSSLKERDRYIRHRGMVDRNKTKGAALSKGDFESARELLGRLF